MTLEQIESSSTDPYQPKRRYRLALILATIAIVTSSITIYELSFHSVDGTHPQLVTGSRGFNFCTTTFYVSTVVWSWAGSLQTQVNNPIFTLTVNGINFGNQPGQSGAFQPYSSIGYPLSFQLVDCNITNQLRNTNTYNIQLNMTAEVYAGIFGQKISKADTATWTLS